MGHGEHVNSFRARTFRLHWAGDLLERRVGRGAKLRRLIYCIACVPPPLLPAVLYPICVPDFCSVSWNSVGTLICTFHPPKTGIGDKSREQKQAWARRIAILLRGRGSAGGWPEIPGAAARTLRASPTPPPLPNRRPWTAPGLLRENLGLRPLPAYMPTPPPCCLGDQ